MFTIVAAGQPLEASLVQPARPGLPTIVFLHEGLGCVAAWKGFPERVATHTGLGALTYSRCGYGGSAARDDAWPVSFMHDEALQILPDVLRQTGVKRPVLFGHSDGGSIALIFAAHFSDAVRAVITEAAHVMVEDVTIAGITDARRRFATGDLRARLARYHGAQTDVLFSRWSDVWCSPAFRGWDIRPLLSGIGCPTLAIQGCTDPYGTRAQAEAIVAGVTGGATALMLEGCGHAPHAEKPRDVMDAIAAFLDALPNESPV